MGGHTHAMVHMEVRGQPLGSILSFHHMGPWDQAHVIRLGHTDLLSRHIFFHVVFILLIFNDVYLGLPVYLFM